MRCTSCGFESEDNFAFCPKCGTKSSEETPINYAADKVCSLFKDRLFLTLCILFTCAGVLSSGSIGIPGIVILVSIFLWICYADAKNGIANAQHLRYLSGTVYANYIIFYILSIVGIILGVSMFMQGTYENGISPYESMEMLIATIFLVGGIILLLLNVFALRKIHRFLKSLYLGVMHGNTDFYKVRAVRNALIVCAAVLGVLTIYLILTFLLVLPFLNDAYYALVYIWTILPIVFPGCLAVVFILAAILINKYFIKETNL